MAAKATTAPDPHAALADELGALKKEYAILIAPFALKKPRMEALEQQLRDACTADADEEWTVHGARFSVTLGKRAEWRIVNIPKTIKAIGQKIFNTFATVTIKDLELRLTADTVADIVHKERVGPRTLKTIEKGSTT